EDNGLAVHSYRHVRQSYNLVKHAATFGIGSRRLDEGWDMLAVRQATLEIATARYKEHVGVGDDFHFGYRGQKEIDEWKARDPLLTDKKLLEALRPEIEREIEKAVAFAESSPAPGRSELLTDVI